MSMNGQVEVSKIESLNIADFVYERSEIYSRVLGKALRFGTLKPSASGPAPRGTIYLLHGGNGDDRQAIDVQLPLLIQGELLGLLVRGKWQIGLPFVGTSFLRSDSTKKERSFSEAFFEEMVPLIEAGTVTSSQRRLITGFSMGGNAALNAFLRYPERFSGAGAHFPTLIAFNYADPAETEEFFRRNPLDEPYRTGLIEGFKAEFTDRQEFLAHDPLNLANHIDSDLLRKKRIYFDVGSADEFGLAEGAARLNEILRMKGIDHAYEEVPGGRHDGPFLAKQLPKLLKYLLS